MYIINYIQITKDDPHFCGDECSYYITVVAPDNATYALTANTTLEYIELPENTQVNFAVSPESATYFKFYLKANEQRFVVINFDLDVESPPYIFIINQTIY